MAGAMLWSPQSPALYEMTVARQDHVMPCAEAGKNPIARKVQLWSTDPDSAPDDEVTTTFGVSVLPAMDGSPTIMAWSA